MDTKIEDSNLANIGSAEDKAAKKPTRNMKTQVQESLQVWDTIQHAVKQSKQMSEPKSMVIPASAVVVEEEEQDAMK
eukprot:14087619-Ditylum_brightwellii.AAC.1